MLAGGGKVVVRGKRRGKVNDPGSMDLSLQRKGLSRPLPAPAAIQILNTSGNSIRSLLIVPFQFNFEVNHSRLTESSAYREAR